MSIFRTIWRTIAHDRRFLIVVLVLIELYYLLSLALIGDVTMLEPMTLVIKYILPMVVGALLLYREIKHITFRDNRRGRNS